MLSPNQDITLFITEEEKELEDKEEYHKMLTLSLCSHKHTAAMDTCTALQYFITDRGSDPKALTPS